MPYEKTISLPKMKFSMNVASNEAKIEEAYSRLSKVLECKAKIPYIRVRTSLSKGEEAMVAILCESLSNSNSGMLLQRAIDICKGRVLLVSNAADLASILESKIQVASMETRSVPLTEQIKYLTWREEGLAYDVCCALAEKYDRLKSLIEAASQIDGDQDTLADIPTILKCDYYVE